MNLLEQTRQDLDGARLALEEDSERLSYLLEKQTKKRNARMQDLSSKHLTEKAALTSRQTEERLALTRAMSAEYGAEKEKAKQQVRDRKKQVSDLSARYVALQESALRMAQMKGKL